MLTRSLGWLAILLLLVGIVRSVPMSPARTAKASPPPDVVTIDPEATAAAEIEKSQPVFELEEWMPSIEERIEVLETRSSDHQAQIESLVERQAQTVDLLGRVVASQERLHRTVLGELEQSAAESKPPQSTPPLELKREQLSSRLFAFGAEWCEPCKKWKASPDAEKIAAGGCEIIPVDVDKIAEGKPRPPQVPYFELHIGDKFARHTGHLTFERFKAMEEAITLRLNNQPPEPSKANAAPPKKWRIDEGHITPSVEGATIEYHLTEHHSVDITGMTVAQMESKHQSIDHSKMNDTAYQRSPTASARLKDMPRALGWMRVAK